MIKLKKWYTTILMINWIHVWIMQKTLPGFFFILKKRITKYIKYFTNWIQQVEISDECLKVKWLRQISCCLRNVETSISFFFFNRQQYFWKTNTSHFSFSYLIIGSYRGKSVNNLFMTVSKIFQIFYN